MAFLSFVVILFLNVGIAVNIFLQCNSCGCCRLCRVIMSSNFFLLIFSYYGLILANTLYVSQTKCPSLTWPLFRMRHMDMKLKDEVGN